MVIIARPDTARTGPLRIGELAARTSVTAGGLRYYERLGLVPPPARSRGGYRMYPAPLVERVSFIKKAQALGLTLEQVREILRAADQGTPPCAHVRRTLAARLAEIEARLAELQSLRATIQRALARSRRLPLATMCICEIIESQTSANREAS